jgi:hypothetical protein
MSKRYAPSPGGRKEMGPGPIGTVAIIILASISISLLMGLIVWFLDSKRESGASRPVPVPPAVEHRVDRFAVRSACDGFGRRIYLIADRSVFVIDPAPECPRPEARPG